MSVSYYVNSRLGAALLTSNGYSLLKDLVAGKRIRFSLHATSFGYRAVIAPAPMYSVVTDGLADVAEGHLVCNHYTRSAVERFEYLQRRRPSAKKETRDLLRKMDQIVKDPSVKLVLRSSSYAPRFWIDVEGRSFFGMLSAFNVQALVQGGRVSADHKDLEVAVGVRLDELNYVSTSKTLKGNDPQFVRLLEALQSRSRDLIAQLMSRKL